MKANPDGISVTLMSEIAKRKGMAHVSKSHMFDLKKAYMAKFGAPRPGDEAKILDWAIANERSSGRSVTLPKSRADGVKANAVDPLLAAAFTVLRNMRIQSISFFK